MPPRRSPGTTAVALLEAMADQPHYENPAGSDIAHPTDATTAVPDAHATAHYTPPSLRSPPSVGEACRHYTVGKKHHVCSWLHQRHHFKRMSQRIVSNP